MGTELQHPDSSPHCRPVKRIFTLLLALLFFLTNQSEHGTGLLAGLLCFFFKVTFLSGATTPIHQFANIFFQ